MFPLGVGLRNEGMSMVVLAVVLGPMGVQIWLGTPVGVALWYKEVGVEVQGQEMKVLVVQRRRLRAVCCSLHVHLVCCSTSQRQQSFEQR